MNKRQKAIIFDFLIVIGLTTVAVIAIVDFRNWVNHTEATRAMEHLSRIVLRYREAHGCVPPESYVDDIKENLQGYARLGDMRYRARWIDFESTADEILAYAERSYRSLLVDDGFLVLRLDGRVEFMDKRQFKKLLAEQQTSLEIEMTEIKSSVP